MRRTATTLAALVAGFALAAGPAAAEEFDLGVCMADLPAEDCIEIATTDTVDDIIWGP